jgi:subtilisin family serine protease
MAAALQDSAAEWGVPDEWAMRPAELCGPAPRSGAVRNKIEVFSMSDAVYFWFPSTRIVKETAAPSDQNPEMTFNDPDFPNQSYLGPNGVNLTPLYDTYRGTGVRIGVVDTGIDYTDVELAGQVDTAAGWDGLQGDSDPLNIGGDQHGTDVSKFLAAQADNFEDGVGAAPEATLVGFRMATRSARTKEQELDLLQRQWQVDISHNSCPT